MKRWLTQSLFFGVTITAAIMALSLVNPAKAQASCGVNTNRESSMAGLIVEMYWWPYGTGQTLEARGVNARVWVSDSRGDSDGYGNIIKVNLPGNTFHIPPASSSNDMTFQQYSSGCGTDGYNVVLGYDASSPNTSGDWGPWVLDCDSSQFGVGNERIFSVTGVGTPQGARAGGSWELKSFRANNGGTVSVTLAYSEPPPPAPRGNFDGASCSVVSGWAYDPNNSGASIAVHAYYGGPAGSGAPGYAHTANVSRPDVNAAFGIGGNHGFSFAPDLPNVTSATTIYIYAISSTGGGNPLIGTRSYGPCTHAATIAPSTTVSPSGWLNPSQNPTFTHKLTVSNYGSINHSVSLRENRRIDTTSGTGTYNQVATKTYTVTGNTTATIWTTAVSVPADATQICEQLVIVSGGGATVSASSSSACVSVRGGKTIPVVKVDNQYVQQGGSANLSGALVTSGYRSDAAGYPIVCNYKLTKTTPSGSTSTVTSSSCNQTITKSDAPNGTVFYTYPYNAGSDPIGTSVCLNVTLTASDFTGTPLTDTKCAVVVTAPYFRALGGDVVAGVGYTSSSGSCSLNSTAVIKSWNNNATPYFGAATELAAIAMGDISNFAAATLADSGASTDGGAPRDLAFANTVSPIGHIGNVQCMPDYYAMATTSTDPTPQAAPGTAIESWGSGIYTYNGLETLGNITLPANDGRNITLAVNGDVYITGNIKYAGASDVSKIPRFTLIAKGNIYIKNTVTELHGAYISNGTIYSCATAAAVPDNSYTNCGANQLTIYGAAAAQNLNLGRSAGSLHDKTQAETFWFSPELWLGGGAPVSGDNSGYDSITSLPPTL